MRVVLDTNVVISAIFWSGPPRAILQLAEFVVPAAIEPVVLEDPSDDKFLSCAVAGGGM